MAMLPAHAAHKVDTYEQAQAKLNADGYLLFIHGKGWDKRSEKLMTELYNSQEIARAAGNAAMMLVPLPESMNETEQADFEKIMGKLNLPHVHSKHSFPAVVMYDKAGRIYSIISGPAMVHPEATRIARIISVRRGGLAKQEQLLAAADETSGEERAQLLLEACRIDNLERPDKIQQLIKAADPEDKAGCLAALNYHNTTLGDKAKDMKLADILAAQDKDLINPLLSVQQKQNACAYAIGTIRRRIGMGAPHLIRSYAELMKSLNPDSVLGRSADIVIRDWTHGMQLVRGWASNTLPIQGQATELQGKLPIGPAGAYEVRFHPEGGKHTAKVLRVALYDGEAFIAEDSRSIELTSPASYMLKVEKEIKEPHLFITFDNDEYTRDTRGKITITRQ